MISLSQLANNLIKETKVAIICHVRPDGDTIGSACALSLALKSLNISAQVFCEDTLPEKFLFLPADISCDNIDLSVGYSALIAVDCAEITRLGKYAEQFMSFNNTYNVDHHISNTRYAKHNYVVDLSANAINVYNIITQLNCKIDKVMANFLSMGIMTDTGNFTHKNVDANALLIASKLVELGADQNEIYYQTFKKQTKNRAKLFGTTMSRLRFFHSDRLAIATIFLSDLNITGANQSETEGFVDFIMGIESVEVGACVMEIAPNKFKISLRSKVANVNQVASSFGGGGHVLASGCQISGEYEEVIDKLSFAVSRELTD